MGQDFEKQSRELLEESARRLDGRTLSRLTQARHAALDSLRTPARRRWSMLVPAGVAAAVALLVVWNRPGIESAPPIAGQVAAEDIDMLSDADALAFVDGEDLEFYEWAAGELET
jgi:negative regulator of sigma E activity